MPLLTIGDNELYHDDLQAIALREEEIVGSDYFNGYNKYIAYLLENGMWYTAYHNDVNDEIHAVFKTASMKRRSERS